LSKDTQDSQAILEALQSELGVNQVCTRTIGGWRWMPACLPLFLPIYLPHLPFLAPPVLFLS
jgi:hypothetical protein